MRMFPFFMGLFRGTDGVSIKIGKKSFLCWSCEVCVYIYPILKKSFSNLTEHLLKFQPEMINPEHVSVFYHGNAAEEDSVTKLGIT